MAAGRPWMLGIQAPQPRLHPAGAATGNAAHARRSSASRGAPVRGRDHRPQLVARQLGYRYMDEEIIRMAGGRRTSIRDSSPRASIASLIDRLIDAMLFAVPADDEASLLRRCAGVGRRRP